MKGRLVCVGTFDGVHRGHRSLIDQLKREAQELDLEAMIITFDPNPVRVLAPRQAVHLIDSRAEKLKKLASQGVQVQLMPFDHHLAQLTTEDFMLKLRDEFGAKAILMGYDHRFGSEQSADTAFYKRIGEGLGIRVLRAEPLKLGEELVSSTKIRKLLLEGEILKANSLLGDSYRLGGQVKGGLKLGRTIGYPTANIELDSQEKILPPDGVYAVSVSSQGQCYGGMLYIGKRPTVDQGLARTIEVNIFDFSGDLYGQDLSLSFRTRIRGEMKFNSLEELKAQIAKDEQAVKAFLGRDTSFCTF